jgi:hypothetical protein
MSILYNKTEEFFKKEIKEGTNKLGILHNAYHEEMPTFEQAGCEFAYPDANYGVDGGAERKLNCQIVFGRDRPSHLLSGYGKVGGTPCASIDIVAGRMSGANKKKGVFKKHIETVKRDTVVGNNFALDASRIYISQKCDIDHYFGLPPGDFGRPSGEAGIAIKSDHVRMIGRESVKICVGRGQFKNLGKKGELNSNGDRLIDPRIEFIAGSEEVQPLVKGSHLVQFLEELMNQISKLEQAFLLQNTNIATLKTALATHFHVGTGVGAILTVPDPILALKCISDIPKDLQKIQNSITKALNFEIIKLNYLGIGLPETDPKLRLKTPKNILSRTVYTT